MGGTNTLSSYGSTKKKTASHCDWRLSSVRVAWLQWSPVVVREHPEMC